METTKMLTRSALPTSRTGCCKSGDFSRPVFGIGALIALINGIYSLFVSSTVIVVSFGILLITEIIAIYRITVLWQAKKIAESINDFEDQNNILTEENTRLKKNTDKLELVGTKLQTEVDDLKDTEIKLKNSVQEFYETQINLQSNIEELTGITEKQNENIKNYELILGLFENEVGNIDNVRKELSELVAKYKYENFIQEANNLLTLFGLIDKNRDGSLSEDEMKEMNTYITIVYGETYDFGQLDKDLDGAVSLKEFFEKFRDRDNSVDN
uniref:EF-hand domain-containing protein n=1 Tax=Pithovirus LCPAC404 TaxID=2506597 RepID=A0A481ZDB7_9VIRU|nr:MAG: uncharacterized protein LCPAC404_03600 [Pithovirus LCPAC404]